MASTDRTLPESTLSLIYRHSGDSERIKILGPYGIEALIDAREEGSLTAYVVTIRPGQCSGISYHRIAEECYFVLAGRGIAVLNGQPHLIQVGDFLRLPPGTMHSFNTEEESLKMLNFHVPGCRPNRDVYFVDAVPDGFEAS